MSKYVYDRNIPVEVLPTLKQYLESLEYIIPDWCSVVNIFWEHNFGNTVITCSISYEYRRANLTFGSHFLDETHEGKQNKLIHDLLHIYDSVIYDRAYDIIDEILPADADKKLKKVYFEMLRERRESVTQDLAQLIERIIARNSLVDGIPINGGILLKDQPEVDKIA